ncbi:MAG: DNA translocase FtsK 4TM domain-containing protein [Anaerovoracaceae bacterium]|jgi:S-DNA-T family DNA segregation ATPase FtsK/SpoIIIE
MAERKKRRSKDETISMEPVSQDRASRGGAGKRQSASTTRGRNGSAQRGGTASSASTRSSSAQKRGSSGTSRRGGSDRGRGESRGAGRRSASGRGSERSRTRGGTRQKESSRSGGGKARQEEREERREERRERAELEVRQIVAGVVLLALGIFLAASLPTDLGGVLGTKIGDTFRGLFGAGGYVLPYLLIFYAVLIFIRRAAPFRPVNIILTAVLFLMIDLINAGRFVTLKYDTHSVAEVYRLGMDLRNGGVFGMYVGGILQRLTGTLGLYLIAVAVIAICLLLVLNSPLSRLVESLREARRARREAAEADAIASARTELPPAPGRDRLPAQQRGAEDPPAGSREAGERPFASREDAAAEAEQPQRGSRARSPQQSEEQLTLWSEPEKDRQEARRAEPSPRHMSLTEREKLHEKETAQAELQQRRRNIIDLVQTEFGSGGGASPASADAASKFTAVGDDPGRSTAGANGWTGGSAFGGAAGSAGAGARADNGAAGGTASAAGRRAPDHTLELGGASVATRASETERSDGDVVVTAPRRRRYRLPSLDLLDPPSQDNGAGLQKRELADRAALLEQTLASFHVDARVVNVITGPSVTRYEIEPARGVKVQRITALADDIALNMRARSIRIEAPIPGKAAVGIEIANESRRMVSFREIVGSREFRNHKSKLAFTLGRDIGGKPVVADLARMPHLLIAGATGSGKSVCINTIIASILYKARPEEVKLVLIDPKMVELGSYNGIPHLLIPVVTDASKAAAALNWAVAEMTDRYKKFARTGVRKISEYNALMKERGEREEILSQVVIIIDELADLMMVASSQVEDSICRLAQLARAAGMHLVIATQRPSVDVITGLIKANVPSRIAFMVTSQVDSRTIIDMPGAEKLVGNGDMLFKPQDLNKPKRIQGPFINDDEIARLIDYVRGQSGDAEYSEEILDQIEHGSGRDGAEDEDELMSDAVDTVIAAGHASVSMLQRRFRIGYNRAARIIEAMEQRGIVGPQDGSRPRQVLLTEAEWQQRKGQEQA